ncbi:hypothetical protein LEP1GSC170_0406 [Leptospira interrogans serovar Bataviae str. HAI135]|nr:hypothetical protein LEP1GSC170_0406 [Leptospira interrogans serovar Bataviae str. HAI135]
MDNWSKFFSSSSEIGNRFGIFDCSPLVFFSLSIIFVSVKKVFQSEETVIPEQEFQQDGFFQSSENENKEAPFPGEVTPEVMEWFFNKGLDLNGKPLPAEFLEKENYEKTKNTDHRWRWVYWFSSV